MSRPGEGGSSAVNAGASLVSAFSRPSPLASVNRRRSSSSSSSRSSSSRSSSSRSSGGGGSSRSSSVSAPRVAAPKPKITIPSLAAFLGTDSAYQGALSGEKRSLADFISQLGQKRSDATTQYNTTSAAMDRDRTQQLADLRDEFASRGLIQSGLYGQEQGKFQQQYTDQRNALDQQQTGLLADLMSQQTNYKREQDLAVQAAKQQALQRRAAQYNIGG